MRPDKTLLQEYFETKRPEHSPDEVVNTFIRMTNAILGPQVIDGERRELKFSDVDCATVFDNIGYLQSEREGYTLGINYRWWDEADPAGRYAVLLHELTHIEQSGHGPNFWNAMAEFHNEAKEQYALIESLFDGEFVWDDSDWYVVTMADIPNVEFGVETVPERRRLMADIVGMDEFDPFKLTAQRTALIEYEETTRVPLSDINYRVPSDSTLYNTLQDWLTTEQSYVSLDESTRTYQIEPITVSEAKKGDGREVLVGEDRIKFIGRTLGKYRDNPKIPVRITSGDPPK